MILERLAFNARKTKELVILSKINFPRSTTGKTSIDEFLFPKVLTVLKGTS
jgi:hypothetical protein